MKVKFFDRDMNLLDIRNCQEVSYTRQKNKEYSISFTPVVEKGYDLSRVYFVSFLDDSKGNRLPYSPCGKLVSVSLDGKCSAESIEKYLADVSVLPDRWQWWKGKSLKRVIENHVYGFRTIRFASESELNVPFDSHHIDISVLENGNGEVFAGKGHYWSENNPYELYFYSDGYVIYRIEIPTEARRQDMVLRWGDVTGGATDINVQFSWSDNPNAVGAWTTNVSPLRGEGFTPNETEGIDIPEGNKKYLFIRFNLTYDTGEISTAYPRGINYGKEITTNREDGNNYVYYGTTAILNYFEVIYRTNTFVKVGTVAVSDGKALGADIFDKENLLESLKAISEAYNLVFFCQIDDGVITLNCFDSYIEDRTNEFIISDTKNMRVGKKDVAIDFIQAVEAYGAGSDNDRIHTFVEYTQDVTVNNVKKFEDSEAHTIEDLRESALQYIDNENNDITNVSFEYYAHALSLGDKVKLIVDKKAITSVVTEEKISASVDGIKKEYVIGVKEYPFRTLFANPFSGKFLEKPKVPTNFVVTRMADGWHATWKGETEKYILRYRRSDTSPYNTHTIVGQQFVFPYTEYEKAYEFVLFAVGENGLASDSTKTTEVYSGVNNSIESIVNGTADVGRPDQLENVRATASRDGISFYCDILGDGLKNTLGRIDWEIKASGEQWASARKISTTVFAGTYNFDRVRDGYPEKDAVGLWEVRAKAVNGYDFESEFYSAVAVVNADNYGTWIQEKPTVFNIQSANRAVNVSWQRPANSLGKEIYGLKYYEIQISKNGTNWHKPAVNKTGKDSESDWYDGTGQLRNDSANYTQSLPLTGQTKSLPENTTYYFRVRTVGETNTSDWSDTQTGIALATGIGDIIAKSVKEAQLDDSSVTTEKLKAGAVTNIKIKNSTIEMAKFATGIRPPRVVDTLPVTPFVGYDNGDTVVLTTDSKLYRFTGTGFTKAVDGLDIIANTVTTGAIKAGAIGVDQLASGSGINLVPYDKASFENYAEGFVPAWSRSPLVSASITTEKALDGAKSLKLTTGNTTDGYVYMGSSISYDVMVEAGKKYVISVYLYSPTAVDYELFVRSNLDGVHTRVKNSTISAGIWTRVYGTYSPATGVTGITLRIDLGTAYSTMYVDAWQVEEIHADGSQPSPYRSPGLTTIEGGLIKTGTILSDQIYTKAITTEKLDTNAVTTEKINAGAIIAEKIASDAVTTEKLHVLAKNKINNFSITGTLEGWTTSGTLEDDASGFKKLRFTDGGFRSNVFTVQPNEICSFEFGVACPNYTSLSGAYVGLTQGQSFRQYEWSFTLNKWVADSVSSNAYFIRNYTATTVKYFKTYILGSNVSINDIPAPSATDATHRLYALQLQGTDTTTRLRSGFDAITAGTYWELYNPQIYSGQGGKIVAQQIITPALSAINANVGEITSGILRADIKAGESKPNVFLDLNTEEFRVGNKPSLEDNNHEDAEYLHWKPNFGLFLKLKNLIVDAIASTIRGRFRVRGSTATMAQSVFVVNPESTIDPETKTPANTTDIKTALRCPAGITADLTGNADTATEIKPLGNSITLPATQTSITKIIKIATLDHIYTGTFNIKCLGGNTRDIIKGVINGAPVSESGVRVVYGKNRVEHGIKKIVVTADTSDWNSKRQIYAEVLTCPNYSYSQTITFGVVETNDGTFTPSMTEVSSVEGTVLDSLPLDYQRGDISSYQHVFTKNIIGNLTGNADTATLASTATFASKANVRVSLRHGTTWFSKTWNGLTSFNGIYVWTDGENIYHSLGTSQYVLNKSNSTWSSKTWNGLTNFYGGDIWTDGENIYHSNGKSQYVLNKTTSTWSSKTWNGLTNIDGYYIWTDGENIYYSYGTTQYVLNKSTSTWASKTWNGLTDFDGNRIWTDGENIYYSLGTSQYVLNKSNSTWSAKTWSGLTSFNGIYVWTDGENIYHSLGTSQYVLNKSNSTWSSKTWNGLTNFYGGDIWTDGENIYYNGGTTQYVLPATRHNYVDENKYQGLFGVSTSCILKTLTKEFVFSNETI